MRCRAKSKMAKKAYCSVSPACWAQFVSGCLYAGGDRTVRFLVLLYVEDPRPTPSRAEHSGNISCSKSSRKLQTPLLPQHTRVTSSSVNMSLTPPRYSAIVLLRHWPLATLRVARLHTSPQGDLPQPIKAVVRPPRFKWVMVPIKQNSQKTSHNFGPQPTRYSGSTPSISNSPAFASHSPCPLHPISVNPANSFFPPIGLLQRLEPFFFLGNELKLPTP